MQKNLPIFLTCSILALSFNGAVSFAQQSRQMVIPGQGAAPIAPPLMIEAGDWDAPVPGSPVGRSLFAEPPQKAPEAAPKPKVVEALPATQIKPAAPKRGERTAEKKAVATSEPKPAPAVSPDVPPTFIPVDATRAAWGSLNIGGASAHSPELVAAVPPEAPPASSVQPDIGPRVAPVKRSVAAEKSADDKKAAVPTVVEPAAPPKPKFTGAQGKAKAPELAILAKGAADNGDVLKMTRTFGDWSLSCDMQLELNERVCRIEQSINNGPDDRINWKIATKPNGRPIIVFDFSDKLDPGPGLEVSFSGFEKALASTDWACEAGKCQTSMDIVGPVAGWFSDAPQISFSFTRDGKKVRLNASMKGFQQAMAASQSPLGAPKADPKSAADAPQVKNEKTAQLK
ncbi:MAG: hypothetical protein DI537_05225 [Stutzerimonas stutzeri]|nr:MAG: hypothetical protein DI537_05225 [Stutzerimonas stutzeri]